MTDGHEAVIFHVIFTPRRLGQHPQHPQHPLHTRSPRCTPGRPAERKPFPQAGRGPGGLAVLSVAR